MASAEVTLLLANKVGLHARPASQFVQTAMQFASDITVSCGSRRANAKSILQILNLGAGGGAEISIRAAGPDAETAIEMLKQLVAKKFGEAE
jgi:phosphotransferase system HPr (HPr) family protein